MAYELKNGGNYSSKNRQFYIRRCARLPIHSSSQTQGQITQSLKFNTVSRILLKTDFFTGKMIVTASKKYFSIMMPQLDGEVFPTFVAKRQHSWKRQKVFQKSPKNKRSFGESKY